MKFLLILIAIMIAWVAVNWYQQDLEVKKCEEKHLQASGYINEGVTFYCENSYEKI